MHEFEVGDFVAIPSVTDEAHTGLIVDEEYDPVEDEYFFTVSLSNGGTAHCYSDDLTLVRAVG